MTTEFTDGNVLFATHLDNLLEAISRDGVLTGLAVSENSTPNMSVLVAVGSGFANGTYRSFASQTNVTIDTAHATLDRLDLIILNSSGTLTKVTGTAASPPAPPDLPDGAILLAIVEVDAAVTEIYDADIQDWRCFLGTIEKEMVSTDIAVLSQAEKVTGAWGFQENAAFEAAKKLGFCYSGATEVGSIAAASADTCKLDGSHWRLGGAKYFEWGDGNYICGQVLASGEYFIIRNENSDNILTFPRAGGDLVRLNAPGTDNIQLAPYFAVYIAGGKVIQPSTFEGGACGTTIENPWGYVTGKYLLDDDGVLGSYSERADLADLRAIKELEDPETGEKVRGSWGDPLWDAASLPHYIRSKKSYEKRFIRDPKTHEVTVQARPSRGYISNGKWKGWMLSLHKLHDQRLEELRADYEATIDTMAKTHATEIAELRALVMALQTKVEALGG